MRITDLLLGTLLLALGTGTQKENKSFIQSLPVLFFSEAFAPSYALNSSPISQFIIFPRWNVTQFGG
jgi:hypothetical protein